MLNILTVTAFETRLGVNIHKTYYAVSIDGGLTRHDDILVDALLSV